MRFPELAALVLVACGPPDSGEEETGAPADSHSGVSDSPPGDESDSPGDSDSGLPGDSDSGVVVDSDEPHALDLGIDAAAKLIGEDADGVHEVALPVDGGRDLTGDGTPDLVVGLTRTDVEDVPYSGVVYIVDGAVRGDMELASSTTRRWGLEGYEIGTAVALAGDVNADGFEDLLTGAAFYDDSDEEWGKPGAVFLSYGPILDSTSITDAAILIEGEHTWTSESGGNAFGWSVAGVGDTDADGFDDFLLGAYYYNNYGRAYLFAGPVPESVDLLVDAEAVLDGSFGKSLEMAVAGAGDTNGDGLTDLLLAGGAGAWVFLGPLMGNGTTDDADAVLADSGGTYAGNAVSSAGDVDGDGYADVLLGATGMGDDWLGGAFLASGPFSGDVDLAGATAILIGDHVDGVAGAAVDSAGDVNGDGFDDLLIGAPDTASVGPGTTYVIFGPVTGTRSLGESDVILSGEGGDDQSGFAVTAAGDVDDDGLADILTAGFGDDDGAEDAGAAWLVLGSTMR